MAIVESPRPGPSWNTVSSDGHLTSAGMDKFWRRSREELLIDMEGLSYVGRLKSLSPFSLERRKRRLRGIFAVSEHVCEPEPRTGTGSAGWPASPPPCPH